MPSLLSPPWAFAAEAIDGAGDTHLPQGMHLRCLPAPPLGIPATPLVVTRALLSRTALQAALRQDGVVWVDSKNQLRTPPFTVTPDNPVTAHFPQADAIYAELSADAGAGALRMEAVGSTGHGPQVIASRSLAPYRLAHWTIPMVRVAGTGSVRGLAWLDGSVTQKLRDSAWAVWSLPVKPAPRYQPTADAVAEAKARVDRGAVLRQPLHIAYTAAAPAVAPPATAADAQKRVAQVAGEIDRWLGILLTDLSQPTSALKDSQGIAGVDGTIGFPIEPALLGGSVDPDLGRHLGLGDVDRELKATQGALGFWRIRGLWRWRPEAWRTAQRAAFAAGLRTDAAAAAKEWPALETLGILPKEASAFVDLHAWAVGLVGIPPDRPPAVAIDAVEDRGWLASPPPPDPRRVVRLGAGGFRPRALAAFMAKDSRGPRTLHPFPKGGRWVPGKPAPAGMPLPLVVARPGDAEVAGRGGFEDRDAPEGAVDYRLAPGDWFGRWGDWSGATSPAKARTPPMRPAIEIFTAPPAYGTPIPNEPLSGTIALRIGMPKVEDLPPGGSALARLDLEESFEGSATVTVPHTLASLPAGTSLQVDPATGLTQLVIGRTGPAVPRAGARKVSYTARWVDALGLVSAKADPVARTMVDPRPPPAPKVETRLRYTARPDPEGHARVDLDFASVAGTRYRVFASTETVLLKALDQAGTLAAKNAAAAIRAAAPGAARAEAFKQHKGKFDWDHFESLTAQPIVASGAKTRFVHRVSASLEVLAIYRVLAEGPSGQLSEMDQADLVPFAVPNLGGPARPLVSLVNAGLDPATEGVVLRVKVPVGRAVPVAWRLRRSSVPVGDPLRMRIVAEGPVADTTTEDGATVFEIAAPEPLAAWKQLRFAVEVQAGKPPGAPNAGPQPPPGEWSEASAPVPLAVIPAEGPLPPSAVAIAAGGGGLQVTVTHPAADSLIATALGAYRFELWRIEPGKRPQPRELDFRRGAGATWTATDPGPAPPPLSFVSVSVIDPIGRRSEAVTSNKV